MTNVLNLPEYEILDVRETKSDYHIKARYGGEPAACLKCGVTPPRLHRHAIKEQLFLDTPMHNRRVGVYVQRQRYRCRDCGGTFMEQLPGVDENRAITARLIDFIREKAFVEPFTKLADEVGLSEGTIRNIFHDYVEELEAKHKFATPEYMGIDEAHLLNDMRCVITNLGARTIVDIIPYRDKESVIRRLSRMPDRERVKGVSIDMWRPYLDAAQTVFPDAAVVVDKFHVLTKVGQAAEEVRKAVRAALNKPQRRQLRGDVHILRVRRHRLRPEQRLIVEAWHNGFPQLGRAYDLKEQFYEIYDADTREEAIERFKEWKESIPEDLYVLFGPVAKMVENWREHIFAYWDHRITNAYTEAVNRTLKDENRRGRGYSFEVLRARILYKGDLVVKRPKFGAELELIEAEKVRWEQFVRENIIVYGKPIRALLNWPPDFPDAANDKFALWA